jgi:hypothetical protein
MKAPARHGLHRYEWKACNVAVGVVRSEAVQIAKAVVRLVRGFCATREARD